MNSSGRITTLRSCLLELLRQVFREMWDILLASLLRMCYVLQVGVHSKCPCWKPSHGAPDRLGGWCPRGIFVLRDFSAPSATEGLNRKCHVWIRKEFWALSLKLQHQEEQGQAPAWDEPNSLLDFLKQARCRRSCRCTAESVGSGGCHKPGVAPSMCRVDLDSVLLSWSTRGTGNIH